MSVLSTLALVMLPALKAAKIGVEPERELESHVSDKTHPRFIAGYEAGLKDGRREIAELRQERDDWRRAADEMRRERDMWRERASGELMRQLQQQAQYQQAAQMLNAQANAQYNAQMAMQNALAYGQGALLGQQALSPEMFCNCVPSRAQVWAAHGDGDG